MYSLGVVFFELWTPFSTQMERFVTLNELKQHGNLPPNWSSPEFVQQATLVRWLMKSYGPDRPSAAQVLRSDLLPPRMENESLNGTAETVFIRSNMDARSHIPTLRLDGVVLSYSYST